ncbi:hypothetical protein RHSIM_Rhsim12G0095700 [Rhododendron simsii]|uniref:Uncharacterized protein n=1 Tax=Rhododendron simsii TaxID=118357 RepID=A0A834L8U8_RHOSS|nr:hypothetical protein RHSIM_Rhsim12G0095700 [Rhododendron simsii]
MKEDSHEESAPLESRIRKREKRRKCRTPEEMDADAKLDWVESISPRGFKSERQVSRRSFVNDNDIIILLENQGLHFWTRALLGYNVHGWRHRILLEFGYEPEGDLVNFSRAESIDSDVINNDMYTTIPSVGVAPHKPGKFKDIYRVLNQVVHYNIYPRGAENKPLKRSKEIMYAFVNDAEYRADWARFIF